MKILKLFRQCSVFTSRTGLISSIRVGLLSNEGSERGLCTHSEDSELKELMEYMNSLKNYEKSGVPVGAGTDSDDGFDLGRMRRLMELLGNPHSKLKVRINAVFAFFQCLCSAFLVRILPKMKFIV